MKTRFTLTVALLILASRIIDAQTAPPPDQWKTYTVKGEEFSVTLPHLPEMTSSKTGVPRVEKKQFVQKKRTERVLVASGDGVTYTIYTYENPTPRQSLEEFTSEQIRKSPVAERVQPVTQKFFAGEEHLYRFVASGAPAEHKGVTQFFSSIVIGKKRSGIEVSDGPGFPFEPPLVENVYSGKDVDSKARLLNRPEPAYTAKARKHDTSGVVVLRAVFRSDGTVTNFEVISGLPDGLTEKAIEAARKIKFIPAMKAGKPVSMWMQLEYNFNLY